MFETATAVGLAGAPDPSSGVSLGYHGSGPPGEWAVKALWFASPGFDQPVNISGKRLDGIGPAPQFEMGGERVDQLQIPLGWSPNVSNGYHTYPSAVVVSEPGCYELTVRAANVDATIVMQVELGDQ